MIALPPEAFALSEAWVADDATARWRSAAGHAGEASGSSALEVAPGCRLPRHTDSVEETIIVTAGIADVHVRDECRSVPAGGLAVVPAHVPHEVRNGGDESLRFVAVYAANEVVTAYDDIVHPDRTRERRAVG